MKNSRIFLLRIITFSSVFFSGLGMAVDAKTIKKPKTVVTLETVEVEKTPRSLEAKPVITKKNQSSVNQKENVPDKSNTPGDSELNKPLDLSVHYKATENPSLKIKQNTAAQSPEPNIFASETMKKSQPLQLKGNFLMSPEPEAGKQKSVDGAGIIINLKP